MTRKVLKVKGIWDDNKIMCITPVVTWGACSNWLHINTRREEDDVTTLVTMAPYT